MIMKQRLSKLIFLPIFISNIFVFSQIPIKLNHPASIILKRLSARGEISLNYFGNNSMSSIDADHILYKNNNKNYINSLLNIKLPYEEALSDSLNQKSSIPNLYKIIFNSNFDIKKKYFYQSISDTTLIWIKIREVILRQHHQSHQNFQYLDEISFNGIFDNQLYVSSTFSMFRNTGNQILILNNYRNEWEKYFPEIDMTFWYLNTSSLYLKNSIADIEIANNPFSWGWSSGNSPILSAKATPFNHVRLYKSFGKFNFEYFHGSILDKSIDEIHNENKKREKFIAGHRVKYEISNNIHASISELVTYGNRSPELGYLNPVSFFWAQEHNLGDLDNVFIAADIGYRILPGCVIYNTLLLDELSWKDLFNDWWGNKFSNQFGLFLSFENMSLPDLRIEYTVTRPWTYTHPDFSYSHRQQPLGASHGPASKVFLIESFYLPSSRMIIYGAFEHAQKGVGKGSGLFDNYDTRNKDNDWNTEFLLEDKTYSNKYKLNFQYLLSINLNFRTTIVINNNEYFSNISEKLKRTEKTFIVGLDFNL
jgi:hypothetical protein